MRKVNVSFLTTFVVFITTMRKFKFAWVPVLLVMFLAGCAALQTAQGRTETMVISYESIGTIAFPVVLGYLQEREKNGSLSGDSLVRAKALYKQAKDTYIHAGDLMILFVQGNGGSITPANIASLLRQVAIALADLSGGKVAGNTLTVGKAG
jgi:hypothetical protein